MSARTFIQLMKDVGIILMLSVTVGSPVFAEVYMTVRDGRVSIVAKDATVGEILAEWARVGQTRIVNPEQVPADRVTLELVNVNEQQALDVLLRAASGYIAAPRAVAVADASQFDRIIVMPRSVAPQTTSAPPPAASPSAPLAGETASYLASPPEVPRDPRQPDVGEAQPAIGSGPVVIAVDQQPYSTTAGATAPPSESAQKSFASRRALEFVDPREFQLPVQPKGGAAPSPRVPGQPGTIRR